VEVTVDNIQSVFPKRVEASVVVSPSIYVSGQGFGVTWRVSYAKVAPPQRTTAADVFRDEIEQETPGLSNLPTRTMGGGIQPEMFEEEAPQEEEISVPVVEAPAPAPVPAPAPAPAPAKVSRRAKAVA
jgi:hypothetical protein